MAIVNINVSVTNPPKPSQLLKSGAMISTGGTTLAAGSYQLLTSKDDLKNIVAPAKTISTLAWSANVVTVTLSENHGWSNGDQIPVVISGATPAAYNGAYTASVTGDKTLTYTLSSDPGTATVMGTVTTVAAGEIQQMNTTYWAQGSNRAVYVLELEKLVLHLRLLHWAILSIKIFLSATRTRNSSPTWYRVNGILSQRSKPLLVSTHHRIASLFLCHKHDCYLSVLGSHKE